MTFHCTHCQKLLQEKKICDACGLVSYCSRECQIRNWPNHNDTCALFRKTSKDNPTLSRCDHCNKRESPKSPKLHFRLCSVCRWMKYCSPSCQEASWPKHKTECKDFRKKYKEGWILLIIPLINTVIRVAQEFMLNVAKKHSNPAESGREVALHVLQRFKVIDLLFDGDEKRTPVQSPVRFSRDMRGLTNVPSRDWN